MHSQMERSVKGDPVLHDIVERQKEIESIRKHSNINTMNISLTTNKRYNTENSSNTAPSPSHRSSNNNSAMFSNHSNNSPMYSGNNNNNGANYFNEKDFAELNTSDEHVNSSHENDDVLSDRTFPMSKFELHLFSNLLIIIINFLKCRLHDKQYL